MHPRLMKFGHAVARLSVIGFTVLWIAGGFGWGFSLGALTVSAIWFALTLASSKHYLKSYANLTSRLSMLVPIILGTVLSALAIWHSPWWLVTTAGVISLLAWSGTYTRYRFNRSKFAYVGHGPVPLDAAISPDIEYIREGDMLLTGGGAMDMAALMEASVGHAELVVKNPDTGELMCISSYMAQGAVLNPLKKTHHIYKSRGHFLVVRPTQPLNPDQSAALWHEAQIMLMQNKRFIAITKASRALLYARVPRVVRNVLDTAYNKLPANARAASKMMLGVSGYDLKALVIGTRAPDRWTCVGACTELYMRVGVPIRLYGVGLLGLGTGWLDPILPVRFLYDPAVRVLTATECGETPDLPKYQEPAFTEYLPGTVALVLDTLNAVRHRIERRLRSFSKK